MALCLERKHGALKLRQLGESTNIDYCSMSMALQCLEYRPQQDAELVRHLRELEVFLLNV